MQIKGGLICFNITGTLLLRSDPHILIVFHMSDHRPGQRALYIDLSSLGVVSCVLYHDQKVILSHII